MTRALKNCESHNSHNLTSLFLTRATRVLQRLKVKQPNIAFTYNAPLSAFGFFLAWARMKICNGSDPEESLPATRWKNIRGPGRLAASHLNSHLWTQDAFYLRKHKESEPEECGRFPARRIFFGKRHGIWERSAASHINLQSHWTRDTFYLRKHKDSGRVAVTHIFLGKRYGIWGGWLAAFWAELMVKQKSCLLKGRNLGSRAFWSMAVKLGPLHAKLASSTSVNHYKMEFFKKDKTPARVNQSCWAHEKLIAGGKNWKVS